MDTDTDIDLTEEPLKVNSEERTEEEYNSGNRISEYFVLLGFLSSVIGVAAGASVFVFISEVFGIYGLGAILLFNFSLVSYMLISGFNFLGYFLPMEVIKPDSENENMSDIYDCFREACELQNVNHSDYILSIIKLGNENAIMQKAFGKDKIVVTDSLVENCTDSELISIFNHELKHSKTSNYFFLIVSVYGLSSIISAFSLYIVGVRGLNLFYLIFVIGLISKIGVNYMFRIEENKADNSIPESLYVDYSQALVRLQNESFHVENTFIKYMHVIIDPHPPLNKRLKVDINKEANTRPIGKVGKKISSLLSSIGITIAGLSLSVGWAGPEFLVLAYIGVLIAGTLSTIEDKSLSDILSWKPVARLLIIILISSLILHIAGIVFSLITGVSLGLIASIGVGFFTILYAIFFLFMIGAFILREEGLDEIPSLRRKTYIKNS